MTVQLHVPNNCGDEGSIFPFLGNVGTPRGPTLGPHSTDTPQGAPPPGARGWRTRESTSTKQSETESAKAAFFLMSRPLLYHHPSDLHMRGGNSRPFQGRWVLCSSLCQPLW